MIQDHRPYYLKRFLHHLERWYTEHFIAPQLESLGPGHHMMKPWNVRAHGKHIRIGKNVHVVTTPDRLVSLSTWTFGEDQGHINIGDNVLLCPGVRIDSASEVNIGDNCMFAAGSYVTDADWHDIYDRTKPVGVTKIVTLMDNVWIGDGAIVCKGVTIGKNSVIGAGSVVASDIPENTIAAGNPARVVKALDPEKELITRESIFRDTVRLNDEMDKLERYILHHNTIWGWLRSNLRPRRGD
ncbi:MAG: acyltransferase [Pseudomonadales bacterium]|jgi:acetyltransferase-like isoleucine patch superfamily enzyme